MSATRLLILGVAHFMQPVTGYAIRRELMTWQLEDHVNVKPGSIYSAIRTLVKDRCLAPDDGEPVPYRVTREGEKELEGLLRQSWWTAQTPAQPLLPALTLMPLMGRDELQRALQARAGQLESRIAAMAFQRGIIKDGATGADGEIPEHVREIMDFLAGQAKAELEWSRKLAARLRSGAYPRIQD